MRNLPSILSINYRDCLYSGYEYNNPIDYIEKTLYMTVPLVDNHIEVPVFAAFALRDKPYSDAIAITLYCTDDRIEYKSLPANIRNALSKKWTACHLLRIFTDNEGNNYYGTFGAIFNKDFIPVMMLTWEVEKNCTQNNSLLLRFTRPVLRVAPEVFRKSNAVEKFIINKAIPEALTLGNLCWPYNEGREIYHHIHSEIVPDVKVIVEYCPFRLSNVAVPSISTTNKDLLKVALDNIDELVQ